MCVVENSGRFGGTYAAPITILMLDQYLNDTIATNRLPLVERMSNTNLIPPLMMVEMRKMDSLKKSRQKAIELQIELNNIKDTFNRMIILRRKK
ncbi:MAG: hypothetical protein IPQ08_05575 [Chitinophagaceae bacterium]|nr:hypothetical protein [Chitinophagaceae bacterium]